MRVFVFPLIALGVLAGGYSDEPSEAQMKKAYEHSLAMQVRNALEFVSETGGPEVADHLREIGSDRFTVKSFRKLECTRGPGKAAYLCAFAVDIEMMNTDLQRRVNGRFLAGPRGLTFAEEV
jgi:hypothetical protein